jgi:hypothetical protein
MPAQLLSEAEVRGPTMQSTYLARTAQSFDKREAAAGLLQREDLDYGARDNSRDAVI